VDISGGADQLVQETKQLLLEANTKENAILAAAGLNKQSVEAYRLKDESAMRKELKMKTGAPAVLNIDEIRQLCIRYRLRFLPSNRYAGNIDPLLGAKMLRFLESVGDVAPEYSAERRFFIMAPVEAFTLDIVSKPPDPVLFYRDEKSGLYTVVHKWGNDFTIFRRALGWITQSALHWRWTLFLAFMTLGAGSLLGISKMGSDGWAMIVGVPIIIFGVVRSIMAADVGEWHTHRVFSDKAWNSTEVPDKSMLWM
jgi:hypothetical protein